jgi:hypothetical protein
LDFLNSKSHKKNGAPIIDVITPTGISVGAKSVRAQVSQKTKKAPPIRNAIGHNTL